MAVKAISEFTIQPDRRDEFVRLFESLVAQHFERMRAAGCHSTTIYVVVDDPDKAVEISEWESAEARERMMHSEAMGAFAPLFELLVAPPVRRWSSSCTRGGSFPYPAERTTVRGLAG